MSKGYFLDMGVIVGFIMYVSGRRKQIDGFSVPSVKFLKKNKKSRKVSCFSVVDDEMPKFIKRRKIMLNEVRKKLNDSEYKIEKTDDLYKRDVKRAKKIYSLKEEIGKEKLHKMLIDQEVIIEVRFEYFKEEILDKVVVPLDEIDEELRSHFQAKTGNYSDSRVMASAVQYTTKHKNTELVTTDKKDYKDLIPWLRMYEKFDSYWAPKVIFLNK